MERLGCCRAQLRTKQIRAQMIMEHMLTLQSDATRKRVACFRALTYSGIDVALFGSLLPC